MTARAVDSGRQARVGIALLAGAAVAVVGAGIARGPEIATALALVIALATLHRQLLSWRSLLCLTVLVILFVPIKRYTLTASLPFNLELYRLVVAFLVFGWLTSLLVDPSVRLRASGFEAPLMAFLCLLFLSLVVNRTRVNEVGADVVKSLTFFASFILVFYVVLSVVRTPRDIDFLVCVLVAAGAVLAGFALIEWFTTQNLFNKLGQVIPILHFDPAQAPALQRGGRLRVNASAQHPIALGAAFAVLVPLAIYRARASGQWRWWLAGALLLLGIVATQSRTAVLMLFAMVVVYLLLRTAETRRFWPALIPVVIAIQFALPGTLNTLKDSFFPKGGIIAEQSKTRVGSGRIATLDHALRHEFEPHPILGEGFGTRVTTPDQAVHNANGPILDDEWLGVLLETGLLGAAAMAWFFLRLIRRLGQAGKRDRSPRGWLLVAAAASIAEFAISMFTYDAFSFIQVTFLLFIVAGIGAAALRSPVAEWEQLAQRSAWPAYRRAWSARVSTAAAGD